MADAADDQGQSRQLEREAAFREREIAVKEKEAALREAELAVKREEQSGAGWRSPLVVAIMAAAIAGISNAVVTVVNGRLQRELEDGKAEQTRVLEMIKTGDPDTAAGNLEFLLKAGLITDPARVASLQKFLANRVPGSGPALPPQTSGGPPLGGITGADDAVRVTTLPEQSAVRKAASSVGRLRVITSSGASSFCTAFLVAPDLAITAGHCVSEAKTADLVFRDGAAEEVYRAVLPPVHVAASADGANYAVLRVEGNPGGKRGFLRLSTETPTVGQALGVVLFRASGEPLAVVGAADCKVRLVEGERFYHLCDTGPGSSGAPVLSAATGAVVGAHFSRSEKGGVATRSDIIVRGTPALQSRQ